MADHHGSNGAVAALLSETKDALPAGGEQLDLLAASQRPSGDVLRWDGEKLAAEIERTRKAGRPKGAQNLATRELRQWIVTMLGGTPQERIARWAMLEPEELAKRIGCTVAEAWDRHIALLKELAPYVSARMQPVDDQGRPVPLVALAVGGQVGVANGGDPWDVWFQGRHAAGAVVDVTPEPDA